MKVAFIVPYFPVLSETFILDQITGLIDRGHEVHIYADTPPNEPVMHADVKRYNLLDRTSYMDKNGAVPRNKILRLIGGIGRFVTNLDKDPIALLRSVNVLKFGRRAASLRLLYQIAPFINKGPYDIIHGQFGPSGNLGISLRDKGAFRGKVITTFRGFDISAYPRAEGDHIYDDLFKKGDLFLCVSERIRDRLIRLGCNERKILVHRSGVDTRKFTFIQRAPTTGGEVRILTIARLVEVKGVRYGIEAVTKVVKKYPSIEYRIAGDGPLRNMLQSLIEELKVGPNVKLIGPKRREEILELLAESDILLAPSVTSEKGEEDALPGSVREALARGLAVVSTQYGGIPELVQDGQSGYLVPERDVDAIAEKVEYLVHRPDARLAMGRKGRNHVEEYYDLDKLNDRLVTIYQGLLHGSVSP